jgi:hypothetical protein
MQTNRRTQTSQKPPVMSQKLALGCLALFTLPFVAAGVTAVGSGILQLMQGAPTTTALPLVALGTVFLAAAPAMFTAVMKGMRASAADAAVRAQNPDKPWFWRKEWADGVMTDRKATASWILFGFAIVFVAVSSPMLFVLRREIDKGNNLALVVLLFPLAGAALLVTALYHLMRVRKYGESRSRLDRIPIELGSAFRGDIETHVTENPPDGFLLKLTCVRRVTTGAGKTSTTESILWRDEQTVRASIPMPDGLRIPYTFTIPADAEPSDERNSKNRIVWRLDVSAQVPGIDYAAQFELPVFDVSGSPHPAEHYAHPAITDVSS